MNATKTQARVYRLLQKRGSTLTLDKVSQGETAVTMKALMIEPDQQPAFRFRRDVTDLPNREVVYLLVGIPSEPKRNEDGDPVDANGDPITIADPDKTRSDYIRGLMKVGRKFSFNGGKYTILREMPLNVSDVNLYLQYQCDSN